MTSPDPMKEKKKWQFDFGVFCEKLGLDLKQTIEIAVHVESLLAHRDAALVEKVLGMRELHTHNSIPSYTADADEGCITCIRNAALDDVISLITNREN